MKAQSDISVSLFSPFPFSPVLTFLLRFCGAVIAFTSESKCRLVVAWFISISSWKSCDRLFEMLNGFVKCKVFSRSVFLEGKDWIM